MGPSDAQVVVGTLAVVVHLHEVGLGFLVDLRPTDPSLEILAVDRQALLLKVVLFGEREGLVVMVIQSLLLRSSPPNLVMSRGVHGHRSPPSSGKGRDGGHGRAQFSA